MKGKEIFLISVGAGNFQPEGFEIPFRLTSEYLEMNFVSSYYCKASGFENIQMEGLAFLEKIKQNETT